MGRTPDEDAAAAGAAVNVALPGGLRRRKVGADERLQDLVATVAHHTAVVRVPRMVRISWPVLPSVIPDN